MLAQNSSDIGPMSANNKGQTYKQMKDFKNNDLLMVSATNIEPVVWLTPTTDPTPTLH